MWKQGGTVPELIKGEAAGQCTTEGTTWKRSERRTVHAAEGSRRDQSATASRSDPEPIPSTHTGKRSECVTITRHIKGVKTGTKGVKNGNEMAPERKIKLQYMYYVHSM